MQSLTSNKPPTAPTWGLACAAISTILLLASGCNGGPVAVLAALAEANGLSADLRARFNKAADASNRAVMADTDDASIASAHEAAQEFVALEHDVAALTPVLERLGVSEEQALLSQFGERYRAYRAVDDQVLALAVENTNLKAQGLSFGPARDAADRFKAALTTPAPKKLPDADRCRAAALVAQAVLAVRELQILQGPHIASADDAAMAGIEQNIAALETTASDALNALSGAIEPGPLSTARGALDQFKGLDAQIIKLSRRNSNVRSLDLSLRVVPPLSAACDDSLRALQGVLAKEGSKATR